MELQHNKSEPTIMHVDLNSAFASAEKQADPFLRDRPVGVCAGTNDANCVISPCYVAKSFGVRVGDRVRDARAKCPDIVILPANPKMYRDVHMRFNRIFNSYTPHVTEKSIDESVLDLKGSPAFKMGMTNIAREIKKRVKVEIGDFITVNCGISTNRFLAKTAAGLEKPDGLNTVTFENIRDVLGKMELTDLCGIADRLSVRLMAGGIYTPLQFYDADSFVLKKQIFKSVDGYRWHLRLRGHESDNVEFGRKTVGQSYALHHFSSDVKVLAPLMMKLCEKMGSRLRKHGYFAKGIHVGLVFNKQKYWHEGKAVNQKLYATSDLFKMAMRLLLHAPLNAPVSHIMVNVYDLCTLDILQLEVEESVREKKWNLTDSIDGINRLYGDYTVHSALMMGLDNQVIDRVPFGGTKDIDDLYT